MYKGPSLWSWSYGFEFESRSCWGTTLCDKVCQWLAAGRWFSTASSTNKTDRHDITEILLKVALNTITLTLKKIYRKNLVYLPLFQLLSHRNNLNVLFHHLSVQHQIYNTLALSGFSVPDTSIRSWYKNYLYILDFSPLTSKFFDKTFMFLIHRCLK